MIQHNLVRQTTMGTSDEKRQTEPEQNMPSVVGSTLKDLPRRRSRVVQSNLFV